MIFHGSRATKLGQFDIEDNYCSYCQNTTKFRITAFGKYKHVYWIPFFPLGKVVVAECQHCKRTYKDKELPDNIKRKLKNDKRQISRPVWHWSGLIIIGLLFLSFKIQTCNSEEKEPDPREELLKADLSKLTIDPLSAGDSISDRIKTIIDLSISNVQTDNIEYFSSEETDKLLVLLKVPILKKVKKESRQVFMDATKVGLKMSSGIAQKDLYIGIHGKYNFMMVNTPYKSESSFIVSNKALLDFYNTDENEMSNAKIFEWDGIPEKSGFVELPLALEEVERADGYIKYLLRGRMKDKPLGFHLKLKENIKKGISDNGPTSNAFVTDGIIIESAGEMSNYFLEALAIKYKIEQPNYLLKNQALTIANLNENDIDYSNGKGDFKLFLEDDGRSAEIYFNIDFRNHRVLIKEKDTFYREEFVKLMNGG